MLGKIFDGEKATLQEKFSERVELRASNGQWANRLNHFDS